MMNRPKGWAHDRDHFFKYMSSDAAVATLANGTLRWSAASCLNDPFDSQFDLHLEYDVARLTERVLDNNWQIVSGKRDIEPGNKLGEVLKLAQQLGLAQKMTEKEFKDQSRSSTLESISKSATGAPILHASMRKELADFKFLCLAEAHNNLLMWSHYAHHHSGVVLKLLCRRDLDSMWGAANPVRYVRQMPRLLTEDDFVRFLGGEFSLETKVTLENVILTKAEDWAYEREWRVPLAGTKASEQWQDIGFHSRELGAVYLGCRTSDTTRETVKALLGAKYPETELFSAKKSPRNFEIEFDRIEIVK